MNVLTISLPVSLLDSPHSLPRTCGAFMLTSRLPRDLFVTVREAYIALRQIKVKKASGPDGIPNIVLKGFAFELAPLITDMYNTSLCEGVVPPSLKHAIVSPPLPKQMPVKSVGNDIRPIFLTTQVAKIMEGFTLTRSLSGIYEDLDCKQFAAAGMSSQHAIALYFTCSWKP